MRYSLTTYYVAKLARFQGHFGKVPRQIGEVRGRTNLANLSRFQPSFNHHFLALCDGRFFQEAFVFQSLHSDATTRFQFQGCK